MNIMYATDKNYACICGVSLFSFLMNNRNVHNTVYIFEKELGNEIERFKALEKEFDVNIRFIRALDIEEECKKYNMPLFRGGYMAYARLFADRFIDLEKVLYLDCDTLIRGNISELWNWNMNGKPVAAVKDCINKYANAFLSRNLEANYYNSGVMIIDYSKWNEMKCLDKIVGSLKSIDINKTATYGDQDIINHAIGDLIATIPPSFNAMYLTRYFNPQKSYMVLKRNEDDYYPSEELAIAKKMSSIIHYSGRNILRPWYFDNILSEKENNEWLQYKKMSPWKDYSLFENKVGKIRKKFLKYYLTENPVVLCKFHGYLKQQLLKKRAAKI